MRGISRAIAIALGALVSLPALAADLPTKKPAPEPVPLPALPSTWHFEATIDGWAPSLSASLGVRNLPALPVYANIFQLLPHLEGYIPVSLVAYNDNFIVGADLLWVRLGLVKGGPGPFGVNAGLTINETAATAYGGLRIPTANPDWRVYAILGARYFNVNGSIDLQAPFGGYSRFASQGKEWVDEIVGVKARHRIDDKWFVDFEGDVGGYHGSATAQGYGAIGYKWSQSLTTSVGYRILYAYYQTPANRGGGSFRFQRESARAGIRRHIRLLSPQRRALSDRHGTSLSKTPVRASANALLFRIARARQGKRAPAMHQRQTRTPCAIVAVGRGAHDGCAVAAITAMRRRDCAVRAGAAGVVGAAGANHGVGLRRGPREQAEREQCRNNVLIAAPFAAPAFARAPSATAAFLELRAQNLLGARFGFRHRVLAAFAEVGRV